ncbi:MAG: MotA/TolQ/ExbB proton channel family protein [Bacteroidaceae bacterium]|nr:MotA/TolQ/ExbB proton channel family protein [Bacteroidaceae bacterium]
MNGLFRLYVEGSVGWMTLVTLALVAVLIAAWKAPNWVRELGLIGLAIGMLGTLSGLCQASAEIIKVGDIAPSVLCGGMKVVLITTMYGVIVCLISVVIDLLHRARN